MSTYFRYRKTLKDVRPQLKEFRSKAIVKTRNHPSSLFLPGGIHMFRPTFIAALSLAGLFLLASDAFTQRQPSYEILSQDECSALYGGEDSCSTGPLTNKKCQANSNCANAGSCILHLTSGECEDNKTETVQIEMLTGYSCVTQQLSSCEQKAFKDCAKRYKCHWNLGRCARDTGTPPVTITDSTDCTTL